jgi:hypothetical protein
LDLTGLNSLILQNFKANNQTSTIALATADGGASYSTNIFLNNPLGFVIGINYDSNIETLTSNSNAIVSSPFTVQTGKSGFELSGTMNFTYGTVGIEGLSKKENIKLYPNPVDNVVNISAPAPVNAMLLSMDGKIIMEERNAQTLDLSSVATGVYTVKISDENSGVVKVERLVKN